VEDAADAERCRCDNLNPGGTSAYKTKLAKAYAWKQRRIVAVSSMREFFVPSRKASVNTTSTSGPTTLGRSTHFGTAVLQQTALHETGCERNLPAL
jgi:hypothetical protein